MSTSIKKADYDYTEYLGPDYKKTNKKTKRVSTIISNHTSWLDPVVFIKTLRPAFSPSAEFRHLPLVGNLIDALDSIYIPRGGSEEKKAKALADIRERQELIEETGKYTPFLIFAEGGTTNGTQVMKFKKGGFFAEKTVKPCFIKYNYFSLNPAFDTIEFLPLAILTLSWAFYKSEVTLLPDFCPNEYLFEKHADKGEERWEIYAWAIRDIIVKQGGFKECDLMFRHKLLYEKYMRMNPEAIDPKNYDLDADLKAVGEQVYKSKPVGLARNSDELRLTQKSENNECYIQVRNEDSEQALDEEKTAIKQIKHEQTEFEL